jgi:hypothetical protein
MSADEGFLTRWARRKHAAATNARAEPQPKHTGNRPITEAAPASLPAEEGQALVDPESLPPIETIGAESDIRLFLANGVPADLARAALRRAWSADPAIRHFIGLSENSWDFNAPGGVPGFGSLTMEDARRLLARVMEETEALGPGRPAAERPMDGQASVPAGGSHQTTTGSDADQIKLARDTDTDQESPMARSEKANIAMQHERGERKSRLPLPRRRHGGALPD